MGLDKLISIRKFLKYASLILKALIVHLTRQEANFSLLNNSEQLFSV